jgi:hypothetical protein
VPTHKISAQHPLKFGNVFLGRPIKHNFSSVEGRLFRTANACSYMCFVLKMALLFFSFCSGDNRNLLFKYHGIFIYLFIYLFLPGCFMSALRVWRSQNNKHPLALPRVELILGTPCSSNITLQVNYWWNFV